MSTDAQVNANRANAQKSTGPKTEGGKSVSAFNAERHGLTGSSFKVQSWEDQQEFEILVLRLTAEHDPWGFESNLVLKMAQHFWLAQRAVQLQETTFDGRLPMCNVPELLAVYMRYQVMHERAYQRCYEELRKRRADKEKQQNGFVSHKRAEAEETRRAERQVFRQNAENRKQELHTIDVQRAQARLEHQNLVNQQVQKA
jgi:hypothetical protein